MSPSLVEASAGWTSSTQALPRSLGRHGVAALEDPLMNDLVPSVERQAAAPPKVDLLGSEAASEFTFETPGQPASEGSLCVTDSGADGLLDRLECEVARGCDVVDAGCDWSSEMDLDTLVNGSNPVQEPTNLGVRDVGARGHN